MDELSFAIQLAEKTGAVLLEYFDRAGNEVRLKADRTVVTEADLAADQIIAEAIRQQYPLDGLISEELQPGAPADAEVIWVVDPLDGTTNFSLGLPIWGVSIARVKGGWPDTAALYFPSFSEMYTAQKGKGAFLNGQPIRVGPLRKDQPDAFFSCCSRTHRRYKISVPYKPRILGSAAYNLCAVARGISLIGFEATAKLWDLAAGWLLVTEAGGVIEPYAEEEPFPLVPGLDYSKRSFPLIIAATPKLAGQARRQIQPRTDKHRQTSR